MLNRFNFLKLALLSTLIFTHSRDLFQTVRSRENHKKGLKGSQG